MSIFDRRSKAQLALNKNLLTRLTGREVIPKWQVWPAEYSTVYNPTSAEYQRQQVISGQYANPIYQRTASFMVGGATNYNVLVYTNNTGKRILVYELSFNLIWVANAGNTITAGFYINGVPIVAPNDTNGNPAWRFQICPAPANGTWTYGLRQVPIIFLAPGDILTCVDAGTTNPTNHTMSGSFQGVVQES